MTNLEITTLLNKYGVEVKRITKRLGTYIVTIAWGDFLKVRDTNITTNNPISLKLV